MERGYWAGRTSFGRRKPVWKRKRTMRKLGYSRTLVPYRVAGYASRFGDPRRGEFKTARLVTEFFVTNTVAAGVPGIQGGPSVPAIVLGTTAASSGPGYNIPFAMQFCLSQVQNSTELGAIFDQYRITWARVNVTYQHNVSTASGTSTMPSLFWVADYDDAIPVGAGGLREHAGVEMVPFSADKRMQVARVTPCFSGATYDPVGPATLFGEAAKRGWLDIGAPNTLHYGLKGYLANVELPATGVGPFSTSFRFDVELGVTFRGFR